MTELPSGKSTTWPADEIPAAHIWAYDHLIEHDCGSLSCGKSIYQIVNDYRFAPLDIPADREVPPGVNADVDGSFYEGGHDK